MKKVLSLFIFVLFLVSLAGCMESSYSKDSLKSGLEKAGYKVDGAPVVVNLEITKLEGFQSALYGYKTVDNSEEGILILIFDSSANANKAGSTEGNVATDFMSMMNDWGRRHAPESDTSVYGVANNVVWAGSQAAKKAAGIF